MLHMIVLFAIIMNQILSNKETWSFLSPQNCNQMTKIQENQIHEAKLSHKASFSVLY